MYCQSCGTRNEDEATFCKQCGKPLSQHHLSLTPPPNYLVQEILVTIFCCVPFGIVAIIFAAQVNGKFAGGDYAGAALASKRAKMWSWISFGSAFAVVFVFFLLPFCAVGFEAAAGG